MSLVQESYRRDIDGLRAVAVVAVVGYHAGLPGFRGGYIGVDVFFVVSGYLITTLLMGQVERNGSVSLVDFYARRIRRLLPALFVMVAVTLLLGLVVLLPVFDEQQDLARSALATALYVSNFYFFLTAPGYFDPSAHLKPLLHTWSLSIEEQFYIVWPVTVVAVLGLSRRWGRPFRAILLTTVSLVLVVSLAWGVHTTSVRPMAAFFLLPSRAWELAAGAALAIVGPGIPAKSAATGAGMAMVGLALVLGSVVMLDDGMAFPGLLAALPVVGTCMLILGGIAVPRNPVSTALSITPLVRLGLLSYSWYLWHWPLLALARVADLERVDLARDSAVALASLLPAYLSYRFVETRIRYRRPGPFRRSETTLVAGVAISVVLCVMAGSLGLWARHAAASRPEFVRLTAAIADRPPMRSRCHQNPPFEGLTEQGGCVDGVQDGPVRLVLWGDSHADHLSPLMQAFAGVRPDGRFLARSFSACTPMTPPFDRTLDAYVACRDFDRAVMGEIVGLRAQGLRGVVLAARWLRSAEGKQVEESLDSLERTLVDLTSLGLRVLVVAPIPVMPYRVPSCLARRGAEACVVPRAAVEEARSGITSRLAALAAGNPRVRVFDPIPALCNPADCPSERDGQVLFLDDRHLTASASRSLLPAASPLLDWAAGLR